MIEHAFHDTYIYTITIVVVQIKNCTYSNLFKSSGLEERDKASSKEICLLI